MIKLVNLPDKKNRGVCVCIGPLCMHVYDICVCMNQYTSILVTMSPL